MDVWAIVGQYALMLSFPFLSYTPLAGIIFLYPCACVWLNASVHTIVHVCICLLHELGTRSHQSTP